MEALVDDGLARSIGVCNFSLAQVESILSSARIKPALHQLELHPLLAQRKLVGVAFRKARACVGACACVCGCECVCVCVGMWARTHPHTQRLMGTLLYLTNDAEAKSAAARSAAAAAVNANCQAIIPSLGGFNLRHLHQRLHRLAAVPLGDDAARQLLLQGSHMQDLAQVTTVVVLV